MEHSVGTNGVLQNHLLSFDDNKVLKLSIGYAKLLEQGCFTSHLLSFDNNKVLKIINWIC